MFGPSGDIGIAEEDQGDLLMIFAGRHCCYCDLTIMPDIDARY